MGMMLGIAYLQFFGYFLKSSYGKDRRIASRRTADSSSERRANDRRNSSLAGDSPFDVFSRVSRAECDTLLFFYGVILCVGELGFIGYLNMASR